MSFLFDILNFILPPRCLSCGKVLKSDTGLCDNCIDKVDFLNGAVCHRCGQPLNEEAKKDRKLLCGNCFKKRRFIFRMCRSACVYDDFSKKLIVDFKFFDRTDLASFLAKMMYVSGKDIFEAGIDVIVPVPLHRTRLLKRRYNQSALLAKELGKLSGVKVDFDAVVKTRMTRPQVECNGKQRLENLRGAFDIKKKAQLAGKRVLLIDDVLTTGATLKECAAAIQKASPQSIDALTIARAL